LKAKKKPAEGWQALAGKNGNHHKSNINVEACQYAQAEVLEQGGYVVIPQAILHDPNLTAPEILCWLALAAHQRGNNWSWPSVTRLAHLTRLSRSTVIRTLKSLESKGYLKRKRRHGTTSLYQLFYRPEQDHRQSGVTVTPLSPQSKLGPNHNKSGVTVTQGGCQSETGVVSQRHPEVEEVNKKNMKKRKPDFSSSQGPSTAQKTKPQQQKTPIKGEEKFRELAENILFEFNAEADLELPYTDFNLQPIIDRLKEGWTSTQLEAVARLKGAEWSTPSMRANQKPHIVFSAKNIARYVEEAAHIVQALEEEYQLAAECERLKEIGRKRKAEGATEEELDQLRAKYAMTRARWQSACDRVETLVSQHRPDWWKRQEREEEWE